MIRYIFIILFAFATVPNVNGQSIDSLQVAPKLGLALSGGGAKGFAHIGLLRIMEEVGLRPDYITGCSMGSIVGGLYALGRSVDDLEEFATHQDWDLLLSNKINLRLINITEKEYFERQIFSLELNDGKLKLPQGLIEGQQLSKILARLSCSAHLIHDFNEFPIPFKCVSVNILDGQIVTHDSGYLARAQRASMSIPTVFTPVEYGDKLLVDGGIIRNMPVTEVIEMGSDITIASYTGFKYQSKDNLQTVIEILKLSGSLYGIADSDEQIELSDYYIDLESQYDAADFESAAKIIEEGEQIARQNIDELRELAAYMNGFERDPPKPALEYPDSMVIHHLTTSNVDSYLEELVFNTLSLKEGETYHINDIENAIDYVYGTQFFKKVDYGIASDSTGTTLELQAKKTAPLTLKFGLNYSNADDAAIILKANARRLFNQPSSLYFQARISTAAALTGHYKQYIGPDKRFAFQFGGAFQRNSQFFNWQRGDLVRKYSRQKNKAYGELLWIPKNNFLFGTGYRLNRWRLTPDQVEAVDLDKFISNGHAIDLFFRWNSLDRFPFPSKGQTFDISGTYNHSMNYEISYASDNGMEILNPFQPDSYFKFHLFASNYSSLSSKFILFQKMGIGITTEPVVFDNFVLGGDYFTGQQAIPFVGLQEYTAPFSKVGTILFGLRYTIHKNIMIDLKGSAARSLGSDTNPQGREETIHGIGVSVLYDSFVGPMSFTLGHSNWNDEFQLAINMGYRFKY